MTPAPSEQKRIDAIAYRYTRVAPMITVGLTRRLGVPVDVVYDLIHETLIRFLERVRTDKFPLPIETMDDRSFAKYVVTAVINRYRDLQRHIEVAQRNEQALISALEYSPKPPDEEVASEELSARLRAAVAELQEPYRTIFHMLLTQDLTLSEIAHRRKVSLGSIYTQYNRGLQALCKIWTTRE